MLRLRLFSVNSTFSTNYQYNHTIKYNYTIKIMSFKYIAWFKMTAISLETSYWEKLEYNYMYFIHNSTLSMQHCKRAATLRNTR